LLRAMSIVLERLADGARRPPHEWLSELRPRERAHGDRPFVYLNMVATADGRATRAGRTSTLGSEADTLLLTELRTLADAVLVGTGTVRGEGYGRLVRNAERIARRARAGLDATPLAVLISRSFELPWEAELFAAADQPLVLYTGADATTTTVPDDVAAPVEVVLLDDPGPAAVLADLRGRGVRSLLCEGGPTLNRALLAAGVVDELFLTLAPLLTGEPDAPRIVEGDALAEPPELALEWVLRHGAELFLRYSVS
jgi:riboflavin-specific deaminase-like protein